MLVSSPPFHGGEPGAAPGSPTKMVHQNSGQFAALSRRKLGSDSRMYYENGPLVQFGRTPALHAGCQGFKSLMCPLKHFGSLAQLEERFISTEEVTGPNPVCIHYLPLQQRWSMRGSEKPKIPDRYGRAALTNYPQA